MPIEQQIRRAENTLRLFLSKTLDDDPGSVWPDRYLPGMKTNLSKKRTAEASILGASADHRLIFYADLGDLITILKNAWSDRPEYEKFFGLWADLEPQLEKLRLCRNLLFHGRELLPLQMAEVLNVCSQIEDGMVKYLVEVDDVTSVWPQIETLRDNFDNYVELPSNSYSHSSSKKPHVGDKLQFVVTTLPQHGDTRFKVMPDRGAAIGWQIENYFSLDIDDKQLGSRVFSVLIQGPRKPHRSGDYDFRCSIRYTIMPKR
jgi:hypothetical protein